MNITNTSKRPISLSLPGGKKLFLGPGKSGQINPKAAELPHVAKLVEEGDLELDDSGQKQSGPASEKKVVKGRRSGRSQEERDPQDG